LQHVQEHKRRPQPAGSITVRQFIESLRRWTPEMRQAAQIALTRSEAERQDYLRGFHARHHEREARAIDSFIRWAYSDPRLDYGRSLFAELERPESDYAGARGHAADVLVRMRAEGKDEAGRVADYLSLLGIEGSEPVRAAIASLLPAGTRDDEVVATIRQMRRRWLELYGDDRFFAE
jgi:hypothetical protein